MGQVTYGNSCAVCELNGISYGEPEKVLIDTFLNDKGKTWRGEGAVRDSERRLLAPIVVLTGAVSSGYDGKMVNGKYVYPPLDPKTPPPAYAEKFAEYIKTNNLGTVERQQHPPVKNHGYTYVTAYLWFPDQVALEAWWQERKPKPAEPAKPKDPTKPKCGFPGCESAGCKP